MWKRLTLGFLGLVCLVTLAAIATGDGRPADPAEVFSDPQTLALARAMISGDADEMASLVASGANPNASGRDGITLLEWEMLRDGYSGFRALLRLGADPSAPGRDGSSALHLAASYMTPIYLEAMLDGGAEVDTPDHVMGRTPLYSALMSNRQRNIDLLLERGASLAFTDRNLETPLHIAASINDFENTLRFLERGADASARNLKGATFQDYIFATPADILNAPAKAYRDRIIAFLSDHDIPLNSKARQREP